MTRRGSFARDEGGLTLIELMIVVLIHLPDEVTAAGTATAP